MVPPRLQVDNEGRLIGPNVTHNSPWPCVNGNPGGQSVPHGIMGVVMHTMVGNLPGTVEMFNESSFQASAHFGIDQDGNIHQFGSVRGWEAWAQMHGNPNWYSIEHADNGNPLNPLTEAQINASAQILEAISRPDVGNFPLQESNSTSQEGYGVHYMGGAAWGGHSCPQQTNGQGPRAGQRAAIIEVAKSIRAGGSSPSPDSGLSKWTTEGMLTLGQLIDQQLHVIAGTVLRMTVENTPNRMFASNLFDYINEVFAADTTIMPKGLVWLYPGKDNLVSTWTTEGLGSLQDIATQAHTTPADIIRVTAEHSQGAVIPLQNVPYINGVFERTTIRMPAGIVLYY